MKTHYNFMGAICRREVEEKFLSSSFADVTCKNCLKKKITMTFGKGWETKTIKEWKKEYIQDMKELRDVAVKKR